MQPFEGKVNFTRTSVRLNVPSYYVKSFGLSDRTEWRIKDTPTAYLLRNEAGGKIHGKKYQGKYLMINIPLAEIDRTMLSGDVRWEVVGRTVKAVLPKGRQSSE